MTRHFITGEELTREELLGLVDRASELRRIREATRNGQAVAGTPAEGSLRGRSVALLFDRPSTRTRVSFQVGVWMLGGNPVVLRGDELQLARGESIKDTALVLSRYVDAIVARTADHAVVEELAAHAQVPVVNALTSAHHPCQVLADLQTLNEWFGRLERLRVAYVGDGNNVCNSLMLLATRVGVELAIATPDSLRPDADVAARAPGQVELSTDPAAAAAGAYALYTDVWISMGDEAEARTRRELLRPFQVNEALAAVAQDDAVVMHCLPAHTGEEITEELLYGERSAVWDQAENRLHAQMALLELLLEPVERGALR
jgi:ornithine carbamoyltransferase